MKIVAVEVPLQDNDIDCGVFLCAFVSQILKLLDINFNFYDIENKFRNEITECAHFQFGTPEIVKFKESFKTLVEQLKNYKS